MILQLRNNKISIKNNNVPEYMNSVRIVYDYELGTNHYKTVLYINGVEFHKQDKLEFDTPVLEFKVELYDTHSTLMKVYTGEFLYTKLCLIGDSKLMNVYKQLQQLQEENKQLKEQGEVV